MADIYKEVERMRKYGNSSCEAEWVAVDRDSLWRDSLQPPKEISRQK